MTYNKIRRLYHSAIKNVAENIKDFAVNPDKDFTRHRKMPADTLISFLIAQSADSTKLELFEFFNYDANTLSESAFNQQRQKLKPEALESIFHSLNLEIAKYKKKKKYSFFAVDGACLTFFSNQNFASEDYFAKHGRSAKGVYSMHLNALYDLENCTYQDAIIQPVRQKNEYLSFATMIDRFPSSADNKPIFIADRGYCSYNNFAHVIEKGAYFLIRSKDITSKGILYNFDFPDNQDSFDIDIDISLVRSDSKKIITNTTYRRKLFQNSPFDFISDPHDVYELSLRVVRFPISDNKYEAIITNLDRNDFPPDAIKELYNERWRIEGSFRELKYTIGLSTFHAYKPVLVMQEIWAKLIAYNLTRMAINNTDIPANKKSINKWFYQINFAVAARLSRHFFSLFKRITQHKLKTLIIKELVPIRNGRSYTRQQSAHFRRPRYLIYRAS